MIQQIVVTGTVKALDLQFKGASAYPVLKLEIATGEKHFELEATGPDALRINGSIGDAPAGTPVRVTGMIGIQKGKDGTNWVRLLAQAAAPDFTGRQGAVGVITGRVAKTEEVERKAGGTFKKPLLGILAADRDGLIADGTVELSFPKADSERLIADWDANLGALVEVEVELSAWISDKGRSFPRYNVTSTKFHAWPSYITAFEPVSDSALDFSAADIGAAV